MSGLLDRNLSRAQTREIIELGGPVLRCVVDEAIGIFERCNQTASDGVQHRGSLMPFHHAIEMLDGVEVLLDRSCVIASHSPLRSAYEASLAARYILADDTQRRGLSYVVGSIYEEVHWHEEHDPESSRGRQFIADMGLEQGSDFPVPNVDYALRLEAALAEEPYPPITAEYERVKKRTAGRVKWHSLFDGPRNLRELARSLDQLDDYLVFYRTVSRTAHATDANMQLTKTPPGTVPAVTAVRSSMWMPLIYGWSIDIGVEVSWAIIQHYRSGESTRFAEWCLEEVSPVVEKLSRIKEEVAE